MQRYHSELGFEQSNVEELKQLTKEFNTVPFKRSTHGLDRLKERFDFMAVLQFLHNDIEFDYENIFEYYAENGRVTKICYRIKYDNNEDMIIVLSTEKAIVTVYLNNNNDSHKTLRKEQYTLV